MINPDKLVEVDALVTDFFRRYKEQPYSSLGRSGAEAINHLLAIIEDYKDELIQKEKEQS